MVHKNLGALPPNAPIVTGLPPQAEKSTSTSLQNTEVDSDANQARFSQWQSGHANLPGLRNTPRWRHQPGSREQPPLRSRARRRRFAPDPSTWRARRWQ